MDYQTVIIGGGPVGFMLASELALAGVKTCVIERLEQPVPHSRALTLHPRTLELLEMRGLLNRFAPQGKKYLQGIFLCSIPVLIFPVWIQALIIPCCSLRR